MAYAHERLALQGSPNHRLRETDPQIRVTRSVSIECAPEPAHVLAQLPHDQIASITSEVLLPGDIFGTREDSRRIFMRIQQRSRSVQTIFIRVPEDKLTEAAEV